MQPKTGSPRFCLTAPDKIRLREKRTGDINIKYAEQRAMGRKVSDRFTVPICRLHHRELHRRGKERAWWQSQGIDPLPVAAKLWAKTHAFASAPANIDGAQRAEVKGRHLTNVTSLAGWSQNDETKPIVRPEAG
jgi:hypothetical protein